MAIRNLILDWSGTLVDDLPPVFTTTNHVFTQCGLPALSLDEFRREFCLPLHRFYQRRIPQVSQEELERIFLAEYPRHRDQITLLPHAREFLARCAEQQRAVYIASSADWETYESRMTQFGIHDYITRAYLGITDKTEKIHQILAENDLSPEETMFVGDMEHDIEAGRAGGVHTCAVLTGYNHHAQLQAAAPDWLCADLAEVQARLENQPVVLTHG